VAGALILGSVAISGARLPPVRSWWASALPGILLVGFGNGFVVWAEQTVPSGLTAVLVAAIPFWQVGVERLFPKADRVGWVRIIGLIVGFSGIVLLVWPDLRLGDSRGFAAGVASTQLACVGWAFGSSLSRRHRREGSVLVTSAIQMLMGGLLMMGLATLRGEWQAVGFTARTAGALAYLVLIGSIVGFSAYGYALRHLPIAVVSLYAYVNPVIAVLLGTLLLSEPLSPRLALASAVVLVGMAMVRERAQ
jgi:drug/metabolite transporter (DMT)-like permease